MAQGLNEVRMIGYVGGEPTLNKAGSTSVAKFQIAINETWLDKERKKQERTTWVTCVAWGRLAETVSKYVHKGSLVHVCGALQNNNYEKNGVKHFGMQVRCDRLIFLNKVRGDESDSPPGDDPGHPEPEGDVPF